MTNVSNDEIYNRGIVGKMKTLTRNPEREIPPKKYTRTGNVKINILKLTLNESKIKCSKYFS